ncbi:MAG: hypothetical protein IPG12_15105 [Saprospiraceae bacterium]|nr:hypothetical protein [Saprospiraceae bacterium]
MRIFTIVLRYLTFSMFMIHIGCNSIDQNNKHIVAETIEFKELNNSKEESFEYFNQRNLIEEFPFEANETYSFYREFIKFKNGLLNNIFYRNLPIWESIGPNNIAGRTLCIAIHPTDSSELWMGSASSGLWKSNSGGLGMNAWKNIPTRFPVASISSIAIQQTQPNTMYIGTGEVYNYLGSNGGIATRTLRGSNGIGILKSTDGGLNWKISLDWLNKKSTAIWKIIIHPTNPNIVFAATNLGVYRSVNNGLNWSVILDLPLVMDLIINPQEPNILYAGVGGINGSHYGVYKTINQGTTWQKINSPNDTMYNGRIMLALFKSNPDKVYAAYSDAFKTIGLLRTVDEFDSTKYYTVTKDVCSYQGWYAKCLHIKDDDSSKLIMGGVDLYLDTTGTGNQFFNLILKKIKIHADMHDIISNPLDPNKIYIATDGGLFRSDNFGESFYPCNGGYISTQFYNGSLSQNSKMLLGGLQDNRTAIYSGTNQWKSIHLGDGTFSAFHPKYDTILYLSSQYQNLYNSFDQGKSWKELIPQNLNASFVSPFVMHRDNFLDIYSGGDKLLHSVDGGIQWDTTKLINKNEKITSILLSNENNNLIYFSTINTTLVESNLYVSYNAGKEIVSIDNGIPERFIRDIYLNSKNNKSIYIALGGTGQNGIMQSKDAGSTWTYPENNGLPDVPFHCILIDPRDTMILYAGCDLGIFVSFDYAKNWQAFNQHPYDVISVYDIQYSKIESKLIIFSHGHGAFKCELPDPIVVSNKELNNSIDINYSTLNKYISLTNPNLVIPHIRAIDLQGKQHILWNQQNKFYTNELKSGIYLIQIEPKSKSAKKIFIIN